MMSTFGDIVIPTNNKHRWVINNFRNRCENLTVGDVIISPTFLAKMGRNKFHCTFRLHPKGKDESSKDWISISLCNNSLNRVNPANISFGIINDKNEVVNNKKIVHRRILTTSGSYWDSDKVIELNFVKDTANGVLNNGRLMIECEIKVYEISNERKDACEKKVDEVTPSFTIVNEYQRLFNDEEFSDVSFTVEGKSLQAHKCILANSSPVFAAMFKTNMKEKRDNTVEVKNIKHQVFAEMLRFIYTGMVNGIDAMAGELLAVADLYALEGLKLACAKSLGGNLSVEDVLETLKLADRYSMGDLKAKAIEFIVLNRNDIVQKPEFRQLPCDLVCDVCLALTNKLNES